MNLNARIEKLEAKVGEDIDVTYEEAAELLIPILKAERGGSTLPCSAAKARAVIKFWMSECAKQPPMTFRQEVDDD